MNLSNNSFKKIFFTFEEKKYHYIKKERGERREGKILLLLPGLTGTYNDLVPFAELLKTRRPVIIPTYPGWAEQPPLQTKHTLIRYAEFLKQIANCEKSNDIIVLGHCMGSTLAIFFALKCPDIISKIILISAPYGGNSKIFSFLVFLGKMSRKFPKKIRPLFFLWRCRFINTLLAPFVLKYKPLSKKLNKIIQLWRRDGEIEDVFEENWISTITFDNSKISQIKVPLYMIYGRQDVLIPPKKAQEFASFNKNAVLTFIPEAGHLPPSETPEELATICNKILNV